MSGLNKVMLIGNLGRDPEVKRTQDGRLFATMSVATAETWKDKKTGERKDQTTWHRVVIFNENLAKIAEQYLRKGSKVYLEGRLRTREYEKDGVKRWTTEVELAQFNATMLMLDGKRDSGTARDEPAQPQAQGKPDYDDEVPF